MQINDRYTCQCCGGRLNRRTMNCEYCGTQYEYNDRMNVIRVETFRNPIKTLACRTVLPREHAIALGAENASQIMKCSIANQLADALTDVMAYQVTYDPDYQQYTMDARIKAIIPVQQDKICI